MQLYFMIKPRYSLAIKAYSYLRFSTKEQALGDSERRQMAACSAYCAKNGLTLDESLKDRGISAYRGKHARVGALAKFLDAIKAGQVEQGSLLIVEALDRLSRQEVLTALTQFIAILSAGVGIVTLIDGKMFTQESVNANPGDLILSITSMTEAHTSSVSKGQRVSEAQATKRKNVINGPQTSKCPGWIEVVGVTRDGSGRPDFSSPDCKHKLIPEKARTMRLIVKLATEGLGAVAIAAKLNRDKVPVVSKRKDRESLTWDGSRSAPDRQILAGQAWFQCADFVFGTEGTGLAPLCRS